MRFLKVLVLAVTGLWLNTQVICAQNQRWSGHRVEEVSQATGDKAVTYLYNVKTNRFLNVGGYWGTQPAVHTVGLPLSLVETKDENVDKTFYRLNMNVKTDDGKVAYVGFVRNCDTASDDVENQGLYVDRMGTSGNYDGIVKMEFIPVEGKDNVYNISFFDTGYKHDADGNDDYTSVTTYIYEGICTYTSLMGSSRKHNVKKTTKEDYGDTWTTDCGGSGYHTSKSVTLTKTGTTTTGIVGEDSKTAGKTFYWVANDNFDVETPNELAEDNAEYGEWMIVTLADLKARFNEATAADADPVNGTFYIKDQNFNRNNTDVSAWGLENNKVVKSLYYVGIGINGNQQQNGKYWTANITGNGTVSQTITVEKPGYYTVSCAGLYVGSSGNASLSATVVGSKEDESTASENLKNVTDITKEDYVTAGTRLKDNVNEYEEFVTVYVPEGCTQIKISVASTDRNGWACFDDVQLWYKGEKQTREILLSEDETSVTYISDQNDSENNYTMRLSRTMKAGQWSSLILPVNLSVLQVKEMFGGNTMLSELVGIDENNDYLINFKSKDLRNGSDRAISAGVMYIIKPENAPNVNENFENPDNIQFSESYYKVDNVTLNINNLPENGIVKDAAKESVEANGIQFCGSYTKHTDKVVGARSFVLSANTGKWYHIENPTTIRGFRAWIATDVNVDANAIKFSIDGILDSDVTAIEGIMDDTNMVSGNKVYGINGQLVRDGSTSLEGLAKGIYIVNNKKYIVK